MNTTVIPPRGESVRLYETENNRRLVVSNSMAGLLSVSIWDAGELCPTYSLTLDVGDWQNKGLSDSIELEMLNLAIHRIKAAYF